MDLATLIPLVVQGSVCLTLFALGLGASHRDLWYLFRRPSLLAKSLLAMNVVMPLLAAALAAGFGLRPALKIALVALAVSPVPPALPGKQLKAGGRGSYAIGLLTAAALLAIVFVPAAVELLGRAFARDVHVGPVVIARLVLITVLVPLAAGIALKAAAPALAGRISRPISRVSTSLLVIAALVVLAGSWRAEVALIGHGTLAALAVFILVGLMVGHLLGGPDPGDRTVLALSTASRHPGIALAIAGATFPGEKLALPAVLVYLIVSAIVSIPYVMWCRRRPGASPVSPASGGPGAKRLTIS